MADQARIEAEIARLRHLGLEELREEWQRQMRLPPPPCFKSALLFRALAYQLQVKAFGGLDRATERLLDRLADAQDPTAVLASLRQRRIKPGTEFIREWEGTIHRVVVVEGGYAYLGQTYRSLSEIARLITGTNWNGPRFFGLRDKGRQAARSAPNPKQRPRGRPPGRRSGESGRASGGRPPMKPPGRALRCAIYTRSLDRAWARAGVQLARCPARGGRGLHQDPGA